MGHQLNIDNADTRRTSAEPAALTGESVAADVMGPTYERLDHDREARASERAARLARVLELAAELRAMLPKPLPDLSTDWMYDEDGLPK